MPNRLMEFFVIDILLAIDKIKRFSADFMTADDFYADEKNFSAITREFEIIGEARI